MRCVGDTLVTQQCLNQAHATIENGSGAIKVSSIDQRTLLGQHIMWRVRSHEATDRIRYISLQSLTELVYSQSCSRVQRYGLPPKHLIYPSAVEIFVSRRAVPSEILSVRLPNRFSDCPELLSEQWH